MKDDLLNFKGVKEGIYLEIKGDDLQSIINELEKKMRTSGSFYKGVTILGITGEEISLENLIEIKCILKYKYNFIVNDEDVSKFISKYTKENIVDKSINDGIFDGIDCGMTKFINGTLRSGQVIEYEGNVVIIGDVNPGALIQAKGNIIVLGTLRGIAQAGVGGNYNAVIAAYNFQPSQLRIGDKISRSPDEEITLINVPEVAKVKDGEVVIEPYLPNK